jgi:hypothetical protein
VNKLKQKLRNAVAEDTSLAVPFLRIAINDGVGFSLDVRALLLDLHYSTIECLWCLFLRGLHSRRWAYS